jgi:hypothetical protein
VNALSASVQNPKDEVLVIGKPDDGSDVEGFGGANTVNDG